MHHQSSNGHRLFSPFQIDEYLRRQEGYTRAGYFPAMQAPRHGAVRLQSAQAGIELSPAAEFILTVSAGELIDPGASSGSTTSYEAFGSQCAFNLKLLLS